MPTLLTTPPPPASRLPTQQQRLRWAREAAGFSTATAFARALGRNITTYAHHENPKRSRAFDVEDAIAYARRLGVDPWWLLSGESRPSGRIRVMARANANSAAESLPVDGAEISALDASELCAMEWLEVVGDSMEPSFPEGCLIGFAPDDLRPPGDLRNTVCVVQVTDGARLLKRLTRGSTPEVFDLLSLNPNHEPLVDQNLDWAALPRMTLILNR